MKKSHLFFFTFFHSSKIRMKKIKIEWKNIALEWKKYEKALITMKKRIFFILIYLECKKLARMKKRKKGL